MEHKLTSKLFVNNLKSSGCAGSIAAQLKLFPQVSNVFIDVDKDFVEVEYIDTFPLSIIIEKLLFLGHPGKILKGIQKITDNARSYMSSTVRKLGNYR